MTTKAPKKFIRVGRRGSEFELAAPIPPTLATIPEVAERAEQHSLVAAKLGELRTRRAELVAELAASERADLDQAAQAAASGKAAPRRQKTASLQKRLEEVEGELRGFEIGIGRSADGLLAVAAPFFEQAIAATRRREQEAIVRATDLLDATRAALAEAEALAGERAWLLAASETAKAEPFRPTASGELARLARDLGETFGQAIEKRALRQAEVEREREREERERPAKEAAEEKAKREYEAGKVVTEGMVVTHRGGRPVKRGQFGGVEEEPAEEIPQPGFHDAEEVAE